MRGTGARAGPSCGVELGEMGRAGASALGGEAGDAGVPGVVVATPESVMRRFDDDRGGSSACDRSDRRECPCPSCDRSECRAPFLRALGLVSPSSLSDSGRRRSLGESGTSRRSVTSGNVRPSGLGGTPEAPSAALGDPALPMLPTLHRFDDDDAEARRLTDALPACDTAASASGASSPSRSSRTPYSRRTNLLPPSRASSSRACRRRSRARCRRRQAWRG